MNKNRIQQIICLCIFVLLTLFSQHSASAQQQNPRLTLKAENEPMEKVMRTIEAQTNYLFIASGIDVSAPVSVDIANGTIQQVMEELLSGTELDYKIDDRYIILAKKTATPTDDSKTLTGTVRDDSGPVFGAAVYVPGTSKGTTTGSDGRFVLQNIRIGDVIEVSFIGYATAQFTYVGQTDLVITLKDDVTEIDQVVVTALGIKREQKALSYNVQQINADDINTIKDANLMNSLAGKVAGATINQSSSGVGGAVKVVMRGVKSIEQNNNALYVIDGIPMYNFGGGGSTEFGSQGATEGIADINPEDIATISVLTGSSAAALYGSNAANGAVLITTKRGEAGKLKVSVSSSTEFLNPLLLPKFQNRYGTGSGGRTSGSIIHSWGPLLNEASYQGYKPDDFFDTGVVFNNAVTLSGGTETNQVFFSTAAINSEGIIPNTKYDRYNFTFRNSTNFLDDKLKLDISASYIIQDDQNMINQGVYSNPLVSAYLFPRGDNFNLVKTFERYDPARKIMTMYWPQGEGDLRMQNPYWIAYRNMRNNNKKRYMLSASLSYEILEWLNVSGRVRVDNSNNMFEQKFYATTNPTLTEGSSQGYYSESKTNDSQVYGDLLVNIDKRFGQFSLMANLGASISDIKADLSSYGGPIREEGIPNVFNVYDLDRTRSRAKRERWQEQTQSIFASVELGWKSMIYLTLTGRNDWASQLANSPESSFFYPSVGLSGIISEMVKMPDLINYLKVRASYSSVGSPFPRHLTSPTYEYDDVTQAWKPKTHYPIGKLYPERTNSWEVGLDARLFRHFSVSGSVYRSNTRNQTFDPQISVSSGYSTIYLQTGHVRNTGAELMLGYSNRWNNFTWDTGATFGWNKNKIIELVSNYEHPETGELITKDRLEIKGLGKAKYILKTGGTLGDLYSQSSLVTDNNGNYIVDSNGGLVTMDNHPDIYLGSVFPKYNTAWRNQFSWKGISAGAVISARVGGIVYSATKAAMDQYGVSETTAAARDAGGVRVNDRSMVDPETWYSSIAAQSGIPQFYTYSATNVRLQEASIGYTIPREKLGNVLSMTVSLIGRNLWMIYCKAPMDPESVATTDNFYQGIDYFMIPSTRSLGFNIRLNF